MKRLQFAAVLALVGSLLAPAQTGTPVPELAAFDRAISTLRAKYDLPGLSLAVGKDGRLVYARAVGVADRETQEPAQPDSLYRVASVSKPITAVGVLKLIEDGKLTLDTRVLSFIGRTAAADPRYADITVRHLLQHSGGMDIEFWGIDPSFPDLATLTALGASLPPTRADVLGFVLANLPLASAPGTKFAYSNIGFMLLTEVIEKASGQPYETYMRERILGPLGISRMRIAGSLLTDRQPGEVRYWDKDNMGAPIFPGLPAEVPIPYGYFSLRIFESGGGWLATTPDLVRFLSAFDAGSGLSILRPETAALIPTRPSYAPADSPYWYGLGWSILRTPLGDRWDHGGALQGTSAWVFRGIGGISLAIATNHLPGDDVLLDFLEDVQGLLSEAALSVQRWPATDLNAVYFPATAPRISHAGVVNAASQRPGPVAAGSVVTLFGLNLTGGTVRINGTVAPTLWTDDGRLQVAVPASASGAARVEVDRNGATSNTEILNIVPEAPAVFTASRNGYGQTAAVNQDGIVNSMQNPAARGAVISLYVTGAGASPSVTIGGQDAEVLYAGTAPGQPSGIQQINARVPTSLTPGEHTVQIRPRTPGASASPLAPTLAVR